MRISIIGENNVGITVYARHIIAVKEVANGQGGVHNDRCKIVTAAGEMLTMESADAINSRIDNAIAYGKP